MFVDTFNYHFNTAAADAEIMLLKTAGYQVKTIDGLDDQTITASLLRADLLCQRRFFKAETYRRNSILNHGPFGDILMKLQIERRYVESLIESFPNQIGLKEQLRFGNKAEVTYQQLTEPEWGFLLQASVKR